MKKKSKIDKNKVLVSIMIFLLLVGIGLIITSLYFIISDYKLEQDAVSIDARIVSYTPEGEGSKLVISYDVEGIKYTKELMYDKQDIATNDTYTIKYNKNNPNIIIENEHVLYIIIFIIIGLTIIIISGNYIVIYNNKIKRVKLLKTEGILIYAKIDEIFFDNQSKKKKGLQPYIVRLKYRNPKDDAVYMYDTEAIYYNIKDIIINNKIEKIPVYLNPKNTYDYFIDVEAALPKEV